MKIPKRARLLGAVVVAALAVGVAAAVVAGSDPRTDPGPTVRHAETLAVTDLADDRKLVGVAHDVFLGRVEQQQGSTTGEPLPETQFEVQVLRTIKGSLDGVVVVSQQGGLDDRGDTVVVDGDAPLASGRTYLFATRTNEATGWHTLIPRYGIVPADARDAQADLVARFQVARATEVPYSAEG